MPLRPKGMKTMLSIRMVSRYLALGLFAFSVSCTTTYDRSGRPVKSVDPGAAAVGVVAAGLIGYALANDDSGKRKHHCNDRYHHGYYGHRPHYGRNHGRNYHCR